ncbi:MAG: hypothetical protein DHS20C12_11950 [Pseudohongiella sp.]|nr:MAG: hypothetical protein DHS20C12_11950 [Pseudohongiella sp.]
MTKPIEEKPYTPSLELTDEFGDETPNAAGSYTRVDGELVLDESLTSKVIDPYQAQQGQSDPEQQADEPTEAEAPTEQAADDIDETVSEVITAFSLVDPDDPKLWTKQSGPKVSALEAVLSYPITEDIRNIAWDMHQQSQDN